MSQDDIAEARRSSESWYWWGIATFFRCPLAETPDEVDIGLVGVPHSSGNGSTERDQHLGPRAVRNVSGYYRRSHGVYGFSPWDIAKISDLGDVPLPEAMNNEACVRDIEAFYARLDATGTRPGRSLDHRADHQGDCRTRPAPVRGPALRADPFRRAHRFLRQHAPLAWRKAFGGALGGLHGEGRCGRPRTKYSDRNARSPGDRDPHRRCRWL